MNSKIKISSAMLVAGIYFSLLFEGYVAALLILGFVLLTESAAPLRRASITAIVIAFSFSILLFLINILPDTISLITNDIIGTFVAKTLNLSSFSKIFAMLYNITTYVKRILFFVFGLISLGENYPRIGFIEKIIDKHAKPVEENT